MPLTTKERSARYKERNPDRVISKAKKHRLKWRSLVFEHYGLECKMCGSKDYDKLVLDHINEDGKEERKKLGFTWGGFMYYKWVVKNGYPAYLQTLCKHCNEIKSAKYRKAKKEDAENRTQML